MNPFLCAMISWIPLAAVPEEQEAPQSGDGTELLERSLLLRSEEVGEVTDMALGRLDGDDQVRLVIAGTRGYAVLDLNIGEVVRTCPFESTLPPEFNNTAMQRRILDVDGDGDLDFMTLAAHWVGRTSRHGSDGKVMWVHPAEADPFKAPAVTSTACGDVDGDGKLKFFMTFNATNEVHLLDASGNLVWSQEWGRKAPTGESVLFLDVDGDDHQDIVYVDGDALWARNGKGDVLAKTTPPDGGYVNSLEIVRSVGEPAKDWLLVGHYIEGGKRAGQNYHLVDLDAQTVGPRVTWEEVELHREAKPVNFPGAAVVSAAIDEFWKQAPIAGISETWLRLRMLDRSRRVVYEETLMAPDGKKVARGDGAILFQEATDSRPARLLVAYGEIVWSYTRPRRRPRRHVPSLSSSPSPCPLGGSRRRPLVLSGDYPKPELVT